MTATLRNSECIGLAKNSFNLVLKGLQRQCLIGSVVTGFNHARTITKTSATGLDGKQVDYNKEICSPGSLLNNPVK